MSYDMTRRFIVKGENNDPAQELPARVNLGL